MAEKQIQAWNAKVLEYMEMMNNMIAEMKVNHLPQQQLMLRDEEKDPTT